MPAKRTKDQARERLAGTYAFRFSGYDRDDAHPRWLTGVGTMVLDAKGYTAVGEHRATNSPMAGRPAQGRGLRHSVYKLTGRYDVVDPGPPAIAEIEVAFERQGGDGDGPLMMWDTFKIVQAGPDRFWLISSNPRMERDPATPRKIQELVAGEAVKVDPATW